MKSLKEIYQRIELRKRKLEQELDEIVEQLRDLGALKIVLFGSFVSGRITLFSDLDIFVVMPAIKSGKEWLRQIYQDLNRRVSCDILVFNEEEYKKAKDKSFLLRKIDEKGRIIYEKRI
jgi:predicted nucleotidyltransferase